MALTPGTRVDGYEIIDLLGAGGMGEVYRARDTRLNRDVALKVLPAAMAGNAAAFARFEREAQAVAALSHPNILAVHDLGRTDAVSYVVFELLQGATLRQRLADGPLPVRKAIDYARQVADGLAAAHARAITHRDIKPDNLFVTDDGRVKILDFGLAQTAAPVAGADQSVTQAPITDAGTVLGTVGYMAPEQVRGQAVDHRADLFALGCVLYEMCAGQRAFKGDTPADTMTAVLSSDPPELRLSGQPPPPALDRIVRRCLEKQPAERFQSARDLSFALDALSSLSGSSAQPVVTSGSSRPGWGLVAAAALAAVVAGAAGSRALWPASSAGPPPDAGPPLRLEFPSSSGATANSFQMALSPDGRYLAYSDNTEGTAARSLLVRDLGTGEVDELPDSRGGLVVSWSPRSDELLYFDRRELRRFRLGGRVSVPILTTAKGLRGGVWLSDDTIVIAAGGFDNLRRLPASGGADTPVVHGDDLFTAPTAIGTRTDYVLAIRTQSGSATNRQVVAVRLTDGQVSPIIDNDAQPQFLQGSLLLPRPTGLFAAAFDPSTLTLTGEPVFAGEPVIWDVGDGATSLTVSQTGVVAYRPGRDRALQFEWLDKTGRSLGVVGPPAFYGSFGLSPDGTRIIVRQINQVGNRSALNLFLIDDARKVSSPVETETGALSDPIWSADGSRILYRFENRLVRQAPSSSRQEVLRQEQVYPDAASPDGRWILGGMGRSGGGFGLYVMAADGSGERQVVAEDGRSSADEASFSPDGRLIAYQNTRSGRPEIYLARFPLTDDRWQVSSEGGLQARWSGDGRTLYYLDLAGRLTRVAVPDSRPEQVGRAEPMFDLGIGPPSLLLEQYAVHGDRFLVLRQSKDSALQTIAVIGNWPGLLRQAAASSPSR